MFECTCRNTNSTVECLFSRGELFCLPSVPGELFLHGQQGGLPTLPGRLQHPGVHRRQQVHYLPSGHGQPVGWKLPEYVFAPTDQLTCNHARSSTFTDTMLAHFDTSSEQRAWLTRTARRAAACARLAPKAPSAARARARAHVARATLPCGAAARSSAPVRHNTARYNSLHLCPGADKPL